MKCSMTPTTQMPKLPRRTATKGPQTETIELAKTRPAEKKLSDKNALSFFALFVTKPNSVVAEVSAVAAAVNVAAVAVVVVSSAAVGDRRKVGQAFLGCRCKRLTG